MTKCRVGISLTLLFTSLIILNYTSTLIHADNFQKNDVSFSSFPDVVVDYNSTYHIQHISSNIQLELNDYNRLTLFFTISGDKTNSEGATITFTFGAIEVVFVIERLYQDHLEHNLTQFFSYPANFFGEMEITITVKAQTLLWYETGSIRIFSFSNVEQIDPAVVTEYDSFFPVVPNWIRFMGSSSSSEIRTVTVVFNNSENFDKVNLTLSFQANDFTAYNQHFEVRINNQLRSTRAFEEDQLTTESFLLAVDSGINFLTVDFVVEICMGEIELSNIHLIGKGIDFEDFLPEDTYSYYEWKNYEFDHTFDLSPLKPIVWYSEQILEMEIDYGYQSSVATSINYEINIGEKALDSGEIITYSQPTTPLSISVKSPLTNSDEPLVFRIQGSAEEAGLFYLLNTSYVSVTQLPELQEQGSLVRILVENESYSTPSSEPLILTFKDYCKVVPDYLHCNVSLSFSLVNEFGSAVRQIDVLMKADLLTVLDEQISYDKQVTLFDNQTLYSNLYEVTIVLSVYGDGFKVTLSNLLYRFNSSIDDSSNTSPFDTPEFPGSNPLYFTKTTIMYVEYGFLLLLFVLIFSQGMLKRKEEGRTIQECEGEEGGLSRFKKIIGLPKKWWSKAKESYFKLCLLPLSLLYLSSKTALLSHIIDAFSYIANSYSLNILRPALGEWVFYPYMICTFVSSSVVLSTLFLISTSTFYWDLFIATQLLGVILFILYLPSSVLLLIYLTSNGLMFEILNVASVLFIFLIILVFLKYLRKNEQNQPDKVIKSFFRTNKSETEEQLSEQTGNRTEKEDLSQEQYNKYVQKLRNYIISKITPEIQVSANRFAEQFHISPELAHTLLIEINNDHSGLGEYFIEERIYKRSPDCEIGRITLDKNTQKNCGELKPSSSRNSVKKTLSGFQNKILNKIHEEISTVIKEQKDENSLYKYFSDGKIIKSMLIRGKNEQSYGLEALGEHTSKLYKSINLGIDSDISNISILSKIVEFYNELFIMYHSNNQTEDIISSSKDDIYTPFTSVEYISKLRDIRLILERADLLNLLITDIIYNMNIILEKNRKYSEVLPLFKLLLYSAELVLIANQELRSKKAQDTNFDLLTEFSKKEFHDKLNIFTSFCGIELLGEKEFKNGKIIRNGVLRIDKQRGEICLHRNYFENFLSKITMKIDTTGVTDYFYKGHSGIDEIFPNNFIEVKYSSSLRDILNNFTYKTISPNTYNVKKGYLRGLELDPLMILFGCIKVPLIIKQMDRTSKLYDSSDYTDFFEQYFLLKYDNEKKSMLNSLLPSFHGYFRKRTKEYGFGQRMMLLRNLTGKNINLSPEQLMRYAAFLQFHILMKDGLLIKFLFFNMGRNERFAMHRLDSKTGKIVRITEDKSFYLESNSIYIQYREDQIGKYLTYLNLVESPSDVKFAGCMEKPYEVVDGDFSSGYIFFYYKTKLQKRFVLGCFSLNEFVQDFAKMKFSRSLTNGDKNPFYDPFDLQLELTTYKVSLSNIFKYEYSFGMEHFISLNSINTKVQSFKAEERALYTFLYKERDKKTGKTIWKQKQEEFSPNSFDTILTYSSSNENTSNNFFYMTFLDTEGRYLFPDYSPYFRFDRGLGYCYFGGKLKEITSSMKILKRAEISHLMEARKIKGLLYNTNESQPYFEIVTVPINIAISQLSNVFNHLESIAQDVQNDKITVNDLQYIRALLILLTNNRAFDSDKIRSDFCTSGLLKLLMVKIEETMEYYWNLYLHAPHFVFNVNSSYVDSIAGQIHYFEEIYRGISYKVPDCNPISQSLFILADLEKADIRFFVNNLKKLRNYNGFEFNRRLTDNKILKVANNYDSPLSFIHNIVIADRLPSFQDYQKFILDGGFLNIENSKVLNYFSDDDVNYKPSNNFYQLIKLVKDFNKALLYNKISDLYFDSEAQKLDDNSLSLEKEEVSLSKFDELYISKYIEYLRCSIQKDLQTNEELIEMLDKSNDKNERVDLIFKWVKLHYIDTNILLKPLVDNSMIHIFKNYPKRGHCASIEAVVCTYSYLVNRIKNMKRRKEFVYLREDLIRIEANEFYLNYFLFKTLKNMVKQNSLLKNTIFTEDTSVGKILFEILQLFEDKLETSFSEIKRTKKDTQKYHLRLSYKKINSSFEIEDMMLFDILYKTYFIYLGSRTIGDLFNDFTVENNLERYIPKKYSSLAPDFVVYELVLNLKGSSWQKDFNSRKIQVDSSYMKNNLILNRADIISRENRLFLPHILSNSTGDFAPSPQQTDTYMDYMNLVQDFHKLFLKNSEIQENVEDNAILKEKYKKLYAKRTNDPLKSSVIYLLKWGDYYS